MLWVFLINELFTIKFLTMPISCMIFDDQHAAISELSFLIGKHVPDWKILGIAASLKNCRSLLISQKVDIIFTEIHFITTDNSFAMQSFQLSTISYILKPIKETNFIDILKRYSDKFSGKNQALTRDVLYNNLTDQNFISKRIAFNAMNGYIIKELENIIYAKAYSNYTEFYFLGNEKVFVAKTLLEYEKMLYEFGFFRIHQSFLVNFNYVTLFENEQLLLHLSSGDILPVSNRKKTLLLEMIKGVFE